MAIERRFLWIAVVAVSLVYIAQVRSASLAVMSIDLGNEYMKIGLVKPGVPMEIVLNVESQRKTPTVVAMRGEDEREFANAALNTAVRFPSSAYMFIRDLVAKNTSSPIVQEFQRRFPYYKIEDDFERGTINFVHAEGIKYSVEELLAMILESAKLYANAFAEQKITDAVIVVPPYFNQAERRAIKRAGELAGLKVLQLMNAPAAVALNYGVFRRKEFNSTAQNYLFFDMGSTSTVATVVSYQVVKMKVGSVVDTDPQLSVLGIGFDRSLGALEFTLRLRDHLAKAFNGQKKTKNDVTKNPRAMAKLLKEAERVKKILSANADAMSQVENLMDEQDFKLKVTRDELELMCSDLLDRVTKPVLDALKSSEMSMSEIREVMLMGGGTRFPKVQAKLQEVTGRQELGKSINTDEAAALGAVYQAAHLSTGFKVKTFHVKDANIYPIQVEFERTKSDEDGADVTKTVKRTLFTYLNPYPQKKVMTFNKHVTDFNINVNYGEMPYLSMEHMSAFGSLNLSTVMLEGVADALNKHKDDNLTESKGVKVHFSMDDSGLLNLDSAEFVFEKTPVVEAEESTLSKLSNTISNFFSGKSDEVPADGKTVEETDNEPKEQPNADDVSNKEKVDDEQEQSSQDNEKTSDDTTADGSQSPPADDGKEKDGAKDKQRVPENKEETEKQEEAKVNAVNATKETKKEVKPYIVKEVVQVNKVILDNNDPSVESIEASLSLIQTLTQRDQEKHKLAAIKNELEAFTYDINVKLSEKDYETCSTEEQREAIREKAQALTSWYEEQGPETAYKDYKEKLSEGKSIVKELYKRVEEYKERPRAIEALKSTLNHTTYMFKSMQNYTKTMEDGPFTETEIKSLDALINETKDWMKTVQKEQKQKALHEAPAYTVEDVAVKIRALDREVKYLLNKAKTWVPKKPKVAKNATDSDNRTAEAEPVEETVDSADDLPTDAPQVEEPPTDSTELPPLDELSDHEEGEERRTRKRKADSSNSDDDVPLQLDAADQHVEL